MASAVALPFENLPLPWDVLFAIAFVVICAMLAWTTTLFVRGIEFRSDWDEEERAARADAFTWVFFTPALNEEITIRDSVERLLALPLARKRVVVIDDGSDDATPAVLAAMDDPRLHVIRREAPEARQGKAAALNDAYGRLDELLPEVPREQVILCVVDADGRLAPDAPARVTEHFEDERVGGVQVLVRS